MAFIGNTSTTQAFTPAVDYFNGNGSSVAFTLSRPVASVAQVQVVIENVPQNPSSAYTVSGNTITFTSAPPSGTSNIYVEYTSPITQVIAPGQGTVTSLSFASGASEFPVGTALIFQQTAAPTGWTKVTTNDNAALRIVSGTAGTGGTVAFTTAFSASNTVDGTAISTAQMPVHNHGVNDPSHNHQSNYLGSFTPAVSTGWAGSGGSYGGIYTSAASTGISIQNAGSGSTHNHTLANLAVKYVDAIVCTKS